MNYYYFFFPPFIVHRIWKKKIDYAIETNRVVANTKFSLCSYSTNKIVEYSMAQEKIAHTHTTRKDSAYILEMLDRYTHKGQ